MRLEYFQMLDRIVDVNIDERMIRTACTIPQADESPVFEGHFPGYPLMPGALLIECMAQTTGWLVTATTGFTGLPALVAVKEAKFRALVLPGEQLEFEGTLLYEGSGYAIGAAKGLRNGAVVCEAQLTHRMMAYPNPTFQTALLDWARRIHFPVDRLRK